MNRINCKHVKTESKRINNANSYFVQELFSRGKQFGGASLWITHIPLCFDFDRLTTSVGIAVIIVSVLRFLLDK
jgi:hypothetical protein